MTTDTMSEQLRLARVSAGLTQAELSKLVKVHRISIVRLETGARSPTVRMLRAIAKATDFTFEIGPTQ
jgi:transcriptional regulator with XRE-family HTH domain